jgi:serine/threonine-protein kinase RsbW
MPERFIHDAAWVFMAEDYAVVRTGVQVTTSNQIEITAHPRNASHARDHIRQAARTAGLPDADVDDIEIAAGEAITNAILYGSPSATSRIVIHFQYSPEDQAFHVEVHDEGHGFDPDKIRSGEDTDLLGGRGIRLMRVLMDEVLLQYGGEGMIVRLTKRRSP